MKTIHSSSKSIITKLLFWILLTCPTAVGLTVLSRRHVLFAPPSLVAAAAVATTTVFAPPLLSAHAYTPDVDPLRESLYLICRVQEACVLQERYIEKQRPPLQKMKLTLRLVDRSYRLLDQINYVSLYISAPDVVAATQMGNEAAEALQEAIDFVASYQQDASAMTNEQKDFLKESLTTTREKLFDFLDYLETTQQPKLLEARSRVERENALNKDEFDPDLATDAGVYNPIVLPWKSPRTTARS